MGEPSYDWEFEKRLLIAIIVMPISTIGVLSIDFSPGVAIFFLIIGTLGVFRLGYRGAVLLWVFLIMYCAYFGLVGGFYGTALLFFITGVVVIFGMLLSEAARKERERVERLRREKERKERVEFEKKQKEKGLVNFVRGDGKEKWGTPEQVKEWKALDIGLSNNFADYTPREFEKFVCDLFRKMGYNVGLTPASGDYGVDVVAKSLEIPLQFRLKNMRTGIWWVHR